MDDKIAEAIGLLRHKIISPVLMESGRSQMDYFRSIESQEFDVPGKGFKKFKAMTMKSWLNKYRIGGFTAIVPKSRSDQGQYRKLKSEARDQIKALREQHMDLSIVRFYERCKSEQILGSPPLCLATVRRFLKNEGLIKTSTLKARKKFEHSEFGALWTADFMHGPHVYLPSSKKRKKAILMAIIDDHSRMIVGANFGFTESTVLLENVFKDSLLTYGLPDRLYVDNGPSFSSHYLSKVCANLGIGLVHSKPYDSPSRGKVERFFRTVRGAFLAGYLTRPQLEMIDILSLNQEFESWLRTHYTHKTHRGIDMRPIDRYQASVSSSPRTRVDEENLEELFFVSSERRVGKDCTISFKNMLYELPADTIGKKVEVRYSQSEPETLYYYKSGVRVQKLIPLDKHLNAITYKPGARDPHVSLQGMVQND